jgi:hypothetical protein
MTHMSNTETTLSDHKDCHLTLSHDTEDPSTWILRKWKRRFIGKRMTLSRWFLTKEQAEAYARMLIKECDAGQASS